MALSSGRQQREYDKFVELADGSTAVRTTAQISGDVNVDNNSVSTSGYIGKPAGQNGDFVTAYTAATQITLSLLPSGVVAFYDNDIVSIQQIDNTGEVVNTYTRDDAVMQIAANVITVTGATFAATDTFVVYTSVARPAGGADVDDSTFGIGVDRGQVIMGLYNTAEDTVNDSDKGALAMTAKRHLMVQDDAYDSLTQSNKSAEVNPLSAHYVAETLIDETNIPQTTTDYAYFDMAGFRNFTLQGETSGTAPADVLTVTVEATCQDDGTAAASCAYQDVTNALFGVASWVDTDFMAIADTPTPFKYVRVKYVTSAGGGNDCDLTVYLKKMY